MELNPQHLARAVRRFLAEDLGRGDITTSTLIDPSTAAQARLVAREGGRLAGGPIFLAVLRELDPHLTVLAQRPEGSDFAARETLLVVQGQAGALLSGERVALNLLARLSGIATLTAAAVAKLAGSHTRLLDTRKTTPGLRELEKYAVRIGGGYNHRFGLDDAVLVKDNHLSLVGGISAALQRLQDRLGPTVKIEVEVEDLDQLAEALSAGATFILLDNMPPAALAEAVRLNAGQAILEASGGINLDDLPVVAATGVDYVSMGRLTHSARSIDLSLEISLMAGD